MSIPLAFALAHLKSRGYCTRPLEGRVHVTLRAAFQQCEALLYALQCATHLFHKCVRAVQLGSCAKTTRKTPRVSGGSEL